VRQPASGSAAARNQPEMRWHGWFVDQKAIVADVEEVVVALRRRGVGLVFRQVIGEPRTVGTPRVMFDAVLRVRDGLLGTACESHDDDLVFIVLEGVLQVCEARTIGRPAWGSDERARIDDGARASVAADHDDRRNVAVVRIIARRADVRNTRAAR